jgi:hypothetical protein
MGLRGKWYRRDPGGFPIFSGGLPLFCNGGLATTCCEEEPVDPGSFYDDDWNEDEDDYEEPCPPPPYVFENWCIATLCNVCPSDPPEVEIGLTSSGNAEDDCYYSAWYEKNAKVTRLFGYFYDFPFDGEMSWTIYGAGASFSGKANVVGGSVEFGAELTSAQSENMASAGYHSVEMRASIQFPDGTIRHYRSQRYVWCWDFVDLTGYTGYAPGQLYAIPTIWPKRGSGHGGANDIYADAQDPDVFNANIEEVVYGPFNSQAEAQEVIDAFEDGLSDYARCITCTQCGESFGGKYVPYENYYSMKIVSHFDGEDSDFLVVSPMEDVEDVFTARACEYFDVYVKEEEQGAWLYLESAGGVMCGGCDTGPRTIGYQAWQDSSGFYFGSSCYPVDWIECPSDVELEAAWDAVPKNHAEYLEWKEN